MIKFPCETWIGYLLKYNILTISLISSSVVILLCESLKLFFEPVLVIHIFFLENCPFQLRVHPGMLNWPLKNKRCSISFLHLRLRVEELLFLPS